MYHNEIKEIIEKIVKGSIDKYELSEYLIDTFDCEKIYDSDEEVITDAFFTLKHYASGEEDVKENEWIYLLTCLNGTHKYSVEEKERITNNPLIRQD